MSATRSRRIAIDLDPPALLLRCATEVRPFALDGGRSGSWGGRHAFVGFDPCATLSVDAAGRCRGEAIDGGATAGDPLSLLERFVARHHPEASAHGGFVLAALSYDLRLTLERLRHPRALRPDQPLLYAAAYDWLLVHDSAAGTWELRARPGADVDLDAVARRIARCAARPAPVDRLDAAGPLRPERTAAEHIRAVRSALDYIAAGDVYQVNVAQRFSAHGVTHPAGFFATLQRSHPVPFGAYVDTGAETLVSNSPECFLSRDGVQVATYPIKGTRPRAVGVAADRRRAAELAADAKERAEHVMIVDLERNDLGRVCRTGSVHVPERMRVASFPSLHHLVSEVRGTLQSDLGWEALLRATFPGGSITGTPKIRAMEVIGELESCERGFYTGCIGLLGSDWARCSIAIRTATVRDGELEFHAGGGIVADSDPEREHEEVVLKSQPFAQALAALAA